MTTHEPTSQRLAAGHLNLLQAKRTDCDLVALYRYTEWMAWRYQRLSSFSQLYTSLYQVRSRHAQQQQQQCYQHVCICRRMHARMGARRPPVRRARARTRMTSMDYGLMDHSSQSRFNLLTILSARGQPVQTLKPGIEQTQVNQSPIITNPPTLQPLSAPCTRTRTTQKSLARAAPEICRDDTHRRDRTASLLASHNSRASAQATEGGVWRTNLTSQTRLISRVSLLH